MQVGNSPQVANGCIEYTCRSVRAEHVIFLDQRLELMLKRLLLACEHGASMIGSWANVRKLSEACSRASSCEVCHRKLGSG